MLRRNNEIRGIEENTQRQEDTPIRIYALLAEANRNLERIAEALENKLAALMENATYATPIGGYAEERYLVEAIETLNSDPVVARLLRIWWNEVEG